ncbi:MAG: sialate O-acetylesterase [Acidobacteria bacterium]|nr:sialate O-acetylesterase [Acidobacteriota bacterium]
MAFRSPGEPLTTRSSSATRKAARNGKLEVRVTRQNLPVPGLDWQAAGQVEARKWTATVKGVPTGGPYRLELRIAGSDSTAAVENILVGDLWILAGQSNMEGVGNLVDVTPPHALVHSLDMTDRWLVAEEPLHNMQAANDAIHQKRRKLPARLTGDDLVKFNAKRTKGAGLGLPFAVEMVGRTGVPVGLLPCGDGGSSMDEWSPALKDQGGDSLYGATVRRFRLAGGRVAGILWYQGESDASPKGAPVYKEKFQKMISAFRADFGQPNLPFYWVQIGRFTYPDNPDSWHKVQDDERTLEAELPNTGMVSSIDSDLDDIIHAGTASLKHLGARLATLACHDLFPEVKSCAAMQRGPRPVSATLQGEVVRVKFSGVNGRLTSAGRPAGFTIHDAAGVVQPRIIFKTRIDPDDPSTVLVYTFGKLAPGMTVHYGYGKDPYCNVKDEADLAVPVFGPIAIQQ